jgi:hypothetical protein
MLTTVTVTMIIESPRQGRKPAKAKKEAAIEDALADWYGQDWKKERKKRDKDKHSQIEGALSDWIGSSEWRKDDKKKRKGKASKDDVADSNGDSPTKLASPSASPSPSPDYLSKASSKRKDKRKDIVYSNSSDKHTAFIAAASSPSSASSSALPQKRYGLGLGMLPLRSASSATSSLVMSSGTLPASPASVSTKAQRKQSSPPEPVLDQSTLSPRTIQSLNAGKRQRSRSLTHTQAGKGTMLGRTADRTSVCTSFLFYGRFVYRHVVLITCMRRPQNLYFIHRARLRSLVCHHWKSVLFIQPLESRPSSKLV